MPRKNKSKKDRLLLPALPESERGRTCSRYRLKDLTAVSLSLTVFNTSTRPIYDYFNSTETIEAEVVKKTPAYFVEFLSRDRTGDKWFDQALGYFLFARREKHLFRCIHDEKHTPFQKQFARKLWAKLGEDLSTDERFREMPEETPYIKSAWQDV